MVVQELFQLEKCQKESKLKSIKIVSFDASSIDLKERKQAMVS
jgi:hypothetical protein